MVKEEDLEDPTTKVEVIEITETRSPRILQTIIKSRRSIFLNASQLGQPVRQVNMK